MAIPFSMLEGYPDDPLGRTWWHIIGEFELGCSSGGAPVVVVHGGPGLLYNCLLRLSRLRIRCHPLRPVWVGADQSISLTPILNSRRSTCSTPS